MRRFFIAVLGAVFFVALTHVVLFATTAGVVSKGLPNFKSTSPKYVKFILTEDKTKVLSVIFDESKGTGTGYNLFYADINFNGIFEENERFEASAAEKVPFPYYIFPVLNLNVPFNEKGKGISSPCTLHFTYLKPSQQELFGVEETIKLRHDSSLWEYIFRIQITPSDNLASVPVLGLVGKPELKITTSPDLQKKGNLGIGLSLMAGDTWIQCKIDNVPISARIEIKTKDGKLVHQDTAGMDKLTFT